MTARRIGLLVIGAVLGLLAVGSSGCSPSLTDLEGFPCADDKTCPNGFTCITDRCIRSALLDGWTDPGADTSAPTDSGADTGAETSVVVDASDGGQDVTTADVGPDAPIVAADIVVLPQSGLTTVESGTTAIFSISLTIAPKANVSIALSSSNTSEVSVSPSTVEFTTANWSTPKVVTLTGVDDAVADGPKVVTITTGPAVSTDPTYTGINPGDVTVTNVDNDSPGFVVSPTGGLSVSETGTTATFTVALVTKPTADVTIPLSSSAPTAATVDTSSLTFTTTNYATPQTVTVTGVDDQLVDGAQSFAIILAAATSADPIYNGINPIDVTGITADNDVAGATVTPTSGLSVSETGTTATFTVVLQAAPSSNVTIPVSSGDATEATVSPASLVFTSSNWSTPQTVTITGVDDAVADGNQVTSIVLGAATSSDAAYNGMNPADVTCSTVDNDAAGATVTPTSGLSVSETGTTATFTVVLGAAPSSNVTIPVSSSDTTEATVSPASIVFTSSNWSTPQTVTVTGVNDAIADGTQNFTIVLGAATSADAAYSGYDPADVTGGTADDDAAGATVTPTSGLSVSETGTTATFTVVLQTAPSSNVTIPVSSSDTTEATVSPASLVFTSSNWSTPQTVTVTGVNDASADGTQNFTILLGAATSADTAYSGYNPTDVTGSTADNDVAGITVTPTTSITVTEGGSRATFTLVLNTAPSANVTIAVSSSNTAAATVSPSSVTFTTTNYGTAQTISVYPVNDTVGDGNKTFNVVLGAATSSDTGYSGLNPADISGLLLDEDTAGVTLTAAATPVSGGYHVCIQSTVGGVKCWGQNTSGQLGLGDTAHRGNGASEMGSNLPAVSLGTGRTALALAPGGYHTCALLDNRQVKCWGSNFAGQLGLGDVNERGDAAGEMGDSLPTVSLGAGRTAKAIASGTYYSCAILDNGTLKCWGHNTYGQLGLGDTSHRGDAASEMGDSLPAISLGTGRTATQLAAGSSHVCALLDNAQVKCWGYNLYGQLGRGDTANRGDGASEMGDYLTTVSLGTGLSALAIVGGGSHTCVILNTNRAKCWGRNSSGQLGLGDTNARGDGASEMGDSLPLIDLGTGRTVLFLSAGYTHSCAILDNYTAKCWGYNTSGDLGLGDTAHRGDGASEMGDSLTTISIGTGRSFRSISAGFDHNCVRLDDARSKCWGLNSYGQLGLGDTSSRGDGASEMGDNLSFLDWVP